MLTTAVELLLVDTGSMVPGDGVTFASLVELLSQAAGQPSGDAEEVATALRDRLVGEPDGPAVGDRLAQVLGVGEALASDASWAVRRLFEVLAKEGVNVQMISTSEIKISVVIEAKYVELAQRALHDAFIE